MSRDPGAIAHETAAAILADIAAGRVPPRPWDGSGDVDPPDDGACMHPGSRCACDEAADYYYRNEVS